MLVGDMILIDLVHLVMMTMLSDHILEAQTVVSAFHRAGRKYVNTAAYSDQF
jgi:hypothetical protein